MEIEASKILEIETQLNVFEHEIKNLEHFFMIKDLKKFNESKNNLLLIQKKINILTK